MSSFHTLAFIGSLGTPEVVGILLLALLLFGAKKIPELARGVGKGLGEFKKAKDEFEHEITRSADEAQKPTPQAKAKPRDEDEDEDQA